MSSFASSGTKGEARTFASTRNRWIGVFRDLQRFWEGRDVLTFTEADTINRREDPGLKLERKGFEAARAGEAPATAISWFDVIQYCPRSKARFAVFSTPARSLSSQGARYSWACDRNDEARTYVSLIQSPSRTIAGANPDFRSTLIAALVN